MKSIFNPAENFQLIERIKLLTPESKPLWGKMNSTQMLAHLQKPIEVANGKLKLNHTLIGFLFGKMAKKSMLKDIPFKKNLPTAKQFIVRNPESFDDEKSKLITMIKRLEQDGPGAITKNAHPFFGKMKVEEWDTLQWKHLDHHLQQFGV